MTARRKPKPRTDDDYVRLDNAICAVQDWWPEIAAELDRRGVGERALSQVLDAMRRVHLGEEAGDA